jgi:hypothetical protein
MQPLRSTLDTAPLDIEAHRIAREERASENQERFAAYAEEAFSDGAMKYVTATKAIMRVAGVKEKRAQGLLVEMQKAGVITKDKVGFYGLKA